jgi:hypothetical protein
MSLLPSAIAPQALAQEDGLVGVDIRNIKKDIAQSINVDPGKIPSTVRVKANIATETWVKGRVRA